MNQLYHTVTWCWYQSYLWRYYMLPCWIVCSSLEWQSGEASSCISGETADIQHMATRQQGKWWSWTVSSSIYTVSLWIWGYGFERLSGAKLSGSDAATSSFDGIFHLWRMTVVKLAFGMEIDYWDCTYEYYAMKWLVSSGKLNGIWKTERSLFLAALGQLINQCINKRLECHMHLTCHKTHTRRTLGYEARGEAV